MQTKLLRPEHAVFLCHRASVDRHNMAFRDEIKCCYVEKINYCDKNSPIKFASFVDHSVFKVRKVENLPTWSFSTSFKTSKHSMLD